MRLPVGLRQFSLLLEGIFHPLHCDWQTLYSYESNVLALVCCFHCSYTNGARTTSIAARSIPLVQLQAWHGCTHWFCWVGDHNLILKQHQRLCYEFLLYKLFGGHTLPIVTATGILCQRLVLGHLLWDFCDLCRPLYFAPTASLWFLFVFQLWPRVQFLWHCFLLRFGKFPTEESYWPIVLSYHGSQLHWGGVRKYLKRLGKVRIG